MEAEAPLRILPWLKKIDYPGDWGADWGTRSFPAFPKPYSAIPIPHSELARVLLKIHSHGTLQKVEVRFSLEIV
jgi:hypothetical protein